MKKLITVSLLLICVSISFSQSKKQQIETLTYKLDSINSVLLRSIDDNEKLSDTKLALESKISLLKKENASKNEEISLKNEKIESLTKEVKSLEQDYLLIVAEHELKSDSLKHLNSSISNNISSLQDSILKITSQSKKKKHKVLCNFGYPSPYSKQEITLWLKQFKVISKIERELVMTDDEMYNGYTVNSFYENGITLEESYGYESVTIRIEFPGIQVTDAKKIFKNLILSKLAPGCGDESDIVVEYLFKNGATIVYIYNGC